MDLFDYALPAERIAQEPRRRGSSRLLLLERSTGAVSHRTFADFPAVLRSGDLLLRNDVRVRPVRLYGRDQENRLVEIFLLRGQDDRRVWKALARPGRRAKRGRAIRFEEDLEGTVEDVYDDGSRAIRFDRPVEEALLERIGRTPLPPYIRREPGAPDRREDREAYQTVFAREPLAVAAPTAGLHFTEEIFARLRAGAVRVADLTLAVGAGTFKPVTVSDAEDHTLASEEVVIPQMTVREVSKAKAEGRRVVAVGTTVTRAIEAAGRLPEGLSADRDLRFATDLFITPGFEFRVVDALLTNFHLPRSTLLMLVAAFGGYDPVMAAYKEAVRQRYRFYSYGDAMAIV